MNDIPLQPMRRIPVRPVEQSFRDALETFALDCGNGESHALVVYKERPPNCYERLAEWVCWRLGLHRWADALEARRGTLVHVNINLADENRDAD